LLCGFAAAAAAPTHLNKSGLFRYYIADRFYKVRLVVHLTANATKGLYGGLLALARNLHRVRQGLHPCFIFPLAAVPARTRNKVSLGGAIAI